MAREPEENEEEYEEEDLDPAEKQIQLLDRQIDHIMDIMEDEDPLSDRYEALTAKLESLARAKENLESARSERVSQDDARENRIMRIIGIASPILGACATEVIRQGFEMRKINRVTKYEDDGNVLTTKATKWCK